MSEIAIVGPRKLREDLLVGLVQHLVAQDMKVAVILDEPVEIIDQAEKDTGRHQAAGATLTLGSSPHHSSLIGKREKTDPVDAFLQHMNPAEVTFVSEETPRIRHKRLVIQSGASDTEGSVTLHDSGRTIATALLSNIEAVAELVTHHLNGPIS